MVEVTLQLRDLPTGYEYTGEYRPVSPGELFATPDGKVSSYNGSGLLSTMDYFIVKRVAWLPQHDETYWIVTPTGGVTSTTCQGSWDESSLMHRGYNVFRTEEEAADAAARVTNLLKDLYEEAWGS